MSKLFGLEFAPIFIPLQRRLQTLAVVYFVFEFLPSGLIALSFLIYLTFTRYWFLVGLYCIWYIYDKDACNLGGRRSEWIRSWKIWEHFRDYFPISLVKTVDLDPDKNYIFGIHPHGILCVGAFCNFGTNATGFRDKFPGLVPHLLTLEQQFVLPFHRELFIMSGACSAKKDSIEWLLTKKGTGNVLCLIVGGAVEALDAIPNTIRLRLNSRYGFIKMALKHGASLVPVISFGENDVYYQKERSDNDFLKKLQVKITSVSGFAPPIFSGRGIFQYTLGLLPYRKPIVTVVGRPIHVEQKSDPSRDEVKILHEEYKRRLFDLFEENKCKYGFDKVTFNIR